VNQIMLGSKRCLGVDFGGSDIKIVELRKSGKSYEIVQAARIKPVDGDAAIALGHFLLETETYPGRVACSMPTNVCSVKVAELPRAKPDEIAKMVRFEAESQIPLPLSDVNWGFVAEGEAKSPTRHVVIASARTAMVDDTLTMTDSAHAYASTITVSALAAVEAIASQPDYGSDPTLIVDIGAEWTDFCAVEGQRLTGCRSVKVGSNDLTEAFIRDFRIDAEEAERMKRSRGANVNVKPATSKSETAESSVGLWVERIAEEVRRSVVSLSDNGKGPRPQRVILVGGIADIPGLSGALNGRTGIPVEIGDPWAGMRRSNVCVHNLRESPAAFAVATGLAKAGLNGTSVVNLMPRRLAEEKALRRRSAAAVSGLAVVAVVLLSLWLALLPGLQRQKAELRSLSTQVAHGRRDLSRSGPDFTSQAVFVTKAAKGIQSEDTSCLELLRKLSANLPRSIWLTEMSFENGKSVVLKGGSLSNSAVADAADSLTLLEIFKTVTLDYSNLTKGEGNQGYEFQLTCVLPSLKTGLSGPNVNSANKSGSGPKTGIIVQ
jgi:type IV pilus assembly protein PilM